MTSKTILELSAQTMLSDYVTAIAWSPLGTLLAVGTGSGEVRLLKNFLDVPLCQPTDRSVDALAFSCDGKWLATGGQDGNITLWQMNEDTPKIADMLECGSAWIDRLDWNPICNHLAFNRGKAVQIWDADQVETVAMLTGVSSPQDIRWAPDGKHLAIALKSNIYIWSVHNWNTPRYQWELAAPASKITWSRDGSYLACAIHDHTVGVLEWFKVQHLQHEPTDENDLPIFMSGFPGKIRQLAWSDLPPAANVPPILAASTRELVTMWMPMPEEWESWVLDLHSGNVLDVAFQPKSILFASLSEDGWIILSQAGLEANQVLEGPEEGFSCLAWHSTGQHLAAGGQQGELFIWSVNTAL
jgi:Tol biopolymer transport system component